MPYIWKLGWSHEVKALIVYNKKVLKFSFEKLTTFFVVKEAHFNKLGFPTITSVLDVKVRGEILHS